MTALQLAGILIGALLVTFAVLFVLGACRLAHDADEQDELTAQAMKGGRG